MAFTAPWFRQKTATGSWSSSLRNIPKDFNNETIQSYLIESKQKTFDKESVRAFKSLKAYKVFKAGNVQKMKTCRTRD